MTTSLHVHVVPSIGIGASVATDHDAWLTTGEPCILCGETAQIGFREPISIGSDGRDWMGGDPECGHHVGGHWVCKCGAGRIPRRLPASDEVPF